jgi:hypothetical protein
MARERCLEWRGQSASEVGDRDAPRRRVDGSISANRRSCTCDIETRHLWRPFSCVTPTFSWFDDELPVIGGIQLPGRYPMTR